MPSDYKAIREANKEEYGNVGRWGRDLLVNRYDSTVHFIFEILQNAEDALRRRKNWRGSREVRFELTPKSLRIVHCGRPFTVGDVKGVCGIKENYEKDLTDIGRFGIGFKSVYTVTDRPEIHSGDEDFAIESFVFPVSSRGTDRDADETEIVLPLRESDADIFAAVADGLGVLGPRTLLFLREIEEISWSVHGGPSGLYLRGKPDSVEENGRRVSLIGERGGKQVIDETWLVFSREARTDANALAGFVEIAFRTGASEDGKAVTIRREENTPLCAFFPTVLATHLGFLVQGPYRTTPSRDNIPPRDPWNVHLVRETAELLVESLARLKALGMLDVAALQSLPLERAKYPEGSMFAPLFDGVKAALGSRALLPRVGRGWVAAKDSRLARTQELRDLFGPKQLGALLGEKQDVHWLSGEITRDTASTLRQYLMRELGVTEITPELVLPRLSKEFLEAQTDEWVLKLYEFLSSQPALIRQGRTSSIPLVRVDDGKHVEPDTDGQPNVFLPSNIKTDFPTVRRAVCSSAKSIEFLRALGLTEPDAVDDVVRNLLPKYKRETVEADGAEYEADIKRILHAFGTQHRGQREKLVAALKETSFVMSVDAGDGKQYVSPPGDVYLATERLKELFAGIAGVMLVDDSYSCLKGEDVRELLEACAASRTLCPEPVESSLSWNEREELRRKGGCERRSSEAPIEDRSLRGLAGLLSVLPKLDAEERRKRAKLLWEALKDVEQRRGAGTFAGTYTWWYYQRYSIDFDAAFVRSLNTSEWVTDAEGTLQRPEFVLFESLGWEPNPFLASKIRFKPPIIDQLAAETGIEPKVLEILKKRGLTSVAELVAALGDGEDDEEPAPSPTTEPAAPDTDKPGTVEDALKNILGGAPEPTPPIPDPSSNDPVGTGAGGTGSGGGGPGPGSGGDGSAGSGGGGAGGGTKGQGSGGSGSGPAGTPRSRTPGSAGGRRFISYLGAHPTDEDPDPDGLDHQKRMDLEAKAIDFVVAREPSLKRTAAGNKGHDLFEAGPDERPVRWVEVKAMTGGLKDRPVGMSSDQFECAQEHGEAFWLYIVEQAGSAEPHLVRIQDPAGLARTFTFDRGWLNVAENDDPTLTP